MPDFAWSAGSTRSPKWRDIMSEETIKRQQNKAKFQAIKSLRKVGYDIIRSDNEKVCVVASRNTEVRIIRICVDKVTAHDIAIVRDIHFPRIVQACREVWCLNGKNFTLQEIAVK
jgi:hypothetical protein